MRGMAVRLHDARQLRQPAELALTGPLLLSNGGGGTVLHDERGALMVKSFGPQRLTLGPTAGPIQPVIPPPRAAEKTKTVCTTCNGSGVGWESKKEFLTCWRCKGSGTQKTGKVTVPCSGCGGRGGKHQTSQVIGKCPSCKGRGSW